MIEQKNMHQNQIESVQRRMTIVGLANLAARQPEQEMFWEMAAARLGARTLLVELLQSIRRYGIAVVLDRDSHAVSPHNNIWPSRAISG